MVVRPLSSNAALESVGNSSETVVVHASQPAISDERLIEHCQQESAFEYRRTILNVSDAVCNMDFATAVLIALNNEIDLEYVRYVLSRRAEGKTLICVNDIRLDPQRYGRLD